MSKAKICFKCDKRKPLEDFYKHPQMADGHLNKCMECAKFDVNSNREKRRAYYRAYDRARGSRQTKEYRKRYTANNPIKYAARVMVNNRVRDGKITKPERCEECNRKTRLHGHHDDYAKLLEVRWLCAACHLGWHAIHGQGLNG